MEKHSKNEETILRRVKEFCLFMDMPVSEFERRCGLSNGYFQKLTTEAIGGRKLADIADAFPDLSINWLLRGEGPMMIGDGSVSASNIGGDNTQNATAVVETIARQLDEKDRQIGRLLGIIENLSKDN